jgi:hypothetical protein
MMGDRRPLLRVVGGNDALVRRVRLSRETRWPPLRIVGAGDESAVPAPRPLPPPQLPSSSVRSIPKRAAWSQALLAGLVVVMLSSVGQAIAHW